MNVHERINRRRRQILVHSCIYYRHNDSIITDETFDSWSRELVSLQDLFPDEASECQYHEHFVNFDGTTGFDLPTWLPEILSKASQLMKYHKGRMANEQA